ncbi:M23 family metallopeptidase [Saccharopolyspora sp. HNM0983]|uniref:M23 family metallopeptidase n=1 Tax=Saccharopolyspora montiporae TaxID=2781240 RepID=A0A929B4W4_9PSEU|nr:M23 family metallopeptidase [Saccharopolyspora sp. HNM0983]MBE9373204.1 M23 family metallopeptidase [Saccharopolyspora sp. HNM0983]
MGKHRAQGGRPPKAALSGPNKLLATAAATGALVAVGQPLAGAGGDATPNVDLAVGGTQEGPTSVQLVSAETEGAPDVLERLQTARSVEADRIARAQAEQQARAEAEAEQRREAEERAAWQAGFTKPAEGGYSSEYGERGGSQHLGLDIANDTGTPIRAVTGGEVISAGPADGFGQWVRLQHDDGTITVYGHIATIDVSEGQTVDNGEQIATMGSEGQSTGPHLHFEVIEDGSTKIDPQPWLQERGIELE